LQLPVNCPYRSKVTNYQRDGPQAYDNQGSAPNYYPNSFSGPEQQPAYRMSSFDVSGAVAKYENKIIYIINIINIIFYAFSLNIFSTFYFTGMT